MLLGTTGISAINIGGTTIHSGLGIKPGTKVLGLNDKSKATFRNRLSEVIYGQLNCLLTFLTKFELVKFMMILKSYSR